MSFIVGTVGNMQNVEAFVSAQDTIKRVAGDLGATSVRASQTIMGGESQGNVQVAFETDTMDQAMALGAGMVKSSEIREMMGAAGASVLRRSLMMVVARAGEMSGTFASGLMMKSDMTAPQAQADIDRAFGNISEGANGMSISQVIATGANPIGTHYVVTYTDSVDQLMAASAKNFADSTTKNTMAATNTVVVGRVLNEVLF
tara:strand:- start:128 stop:733 length:606 start_codon:yes stop_codon:yes gene_type:complete